VLKFIEKAKKIHNDRFDYSLVEYDKFDVKVKIICPEHDEFYSSPSVHLRTKTGGCPKCIGYKSLTEFLIICKNIHGDKYDYSMVKDIKNNRTKLDIICHEHDYTFKFTQKYFNHINRRQGCPLCAGKYSYDYKEFINRANKIHNFKYDYSHLQEDYKDNKTKVRIVCKEHGTFIQSPNSHLRGDGCNSCVRRDFSTVESFINESNKVHNSKYDYSKVSLVSIKSDVIIICPDHGDYTQNAYVHLTGSGCRKCSECEKYTQKSVIDKFKEIHGDKYDYSLVNFKSIREKVEIICKKHGSFLQDPFSHYQNQGCPKCRSSKGEERIIKCLVDNKIQFEYQKKFEGLKNKNYLPIDFYLPDYNLCIEYDGKQHFEMVEAWGGLESFEILKENDSKKDFFCQSEKKNLLRIPYYDFNNIESIIDDFLDKLPKKLVFNYRLPKKSDNFSEVLDLFGKKPFKVKIDIKPNCFENNCHNNVDRYIDMYGGYKISGYYLVYDIDYDRFVAVRHSIWKNSHDEILDITPFSDSRKWNLFIESDKKETFINI
jgi:very-short-patch-repair endonuclease